MREIRSKFPAWMIPLFFQEHLAVGPCRLFLRKHNADGVARAFDGRSHRTSVFQDTFTEISNFIEIPIGSGAVDFAVLSVIGPLKRSTVIAVVVPVVVLAIPIFDTSFAIVRRIVNRKPIMEADKGHLHHRLMDAGYGQRRAVLMLYGISAIMGMAAVLISRELYKDAAALAVIAAVYLYVFLTDPNHKMPHIKAVNIAKEEKKQAASERAAAEEEAGAPGASGGDEK